MIVSAEEANRRLNSPKNVARFTSEPIHLPSQGVRDRGPAIPDFLKITAGILAHTDTAKNVGQELGISPYTVHGYKHGKVGDGKIGQKTNETLRSAVNSGIAGIQERAAQKLMTALGLITEEKMEKVGVKDLSSIAANMSRVIEHTTVKESEASKIQVVIYSPGTREESKFQVIDV